ncbi:MAG: GNAT family N-acetyltransferase [Acidimicrobiia bacterium]|nr:GNAT family N-acetyltransferase [Acidimicrobiia bacterium]
MDYSKIKISNLPDEIEVDEKIVLRASNKKDLDKFIKVILNNIDFLKVWMPWARVENVAQNSREHINESISNKINNISCQYYIIYQNIIVGSIGIHKREETGEFLEIGYWLSEKVNGKGIATNAVKKLTEVCLEATNAAGIDIGCDKDNLISQKIPERLGFEMINHGKRQILSRPTFEIEGPLYRLTRKQWKDKF